MPLAGFNSKMVQLKEAASGQCTDGLSVCFNSKMVQLKVAIIAGGCFNGSLRFNSKMVQLKVRLSFEVKYFRCVFQFQNGTIKRQEGAEARIALRCFNSKMVQLKDIHCPVSNAPRIYLFQFQNGTIKSSKSPPGCFSQPIWSVFQFQNGTIKRRRSSKYACRTFAFQFQNGTIKSAISAGKLPVPQSFNSKMVQLKDRQKLRASCRQFQFQNGTIKSIELEPCTRDNALFQFQNGTIKKRCIGFEP